MQSAATRNAKARTAAIADSRVPPYAMTPGMDSMSAHQRPSSSRPMTIGIDSTVTVSIDFLVLIIAPKEGSLMDGHLDLTVRPTALEPGAAFAGIIVGD